VVDIFNSIAHGDVSAVITLLLVALFAAIRSVANAMHTRIQFTEKAIKRLGGFRQNHDVRLRLIENHVHLETVEYDPDNDNE
jgi:hypothetical protein